MPTYDADYLSDLVTKLRTAGLMSCDLTLPDGAHLVLNMYPVEPKPQLREPRRPSGDDDPYAGLGDRDYGDEL